MKSIVTLASLLFVATLSVGCATVDLNAEGGSSPAQYSATDIERMLADSSTGK